MKPVPIPSSGHRYAVDGFGNIYSIFRGGEPRRLMPVLSSDGYLRVNIHDGKGSKRFVAVHRMVAEVFVSKREGCAYVNHKDGNKTNNSALNLEWVTSKENSIHARDAGLLKTPPKKATKNQIEAAFLMRSQGKKFQEIADFLQCSISTAHGYLSVQVKK